MSNQILITFLTSPDSKSEKITNIISNEVKNFSLILAFEDFLHSLETKKSLLHIAIIIIDVKFYSEIKKKSFYESLLQIKNRDGLLIIPITTNETKIFGHLFPENIKFISKINAINIHAEDDKNGLSRIIHILKRKSQINHTRLSREHYEKRIPFYILFLPILALVSFKHGIWHLSLVSAFPGIMALIVLNYNFRLILLIPTLFLLVGMSFNGIKIGSNASYFFSTIAFFVIFFSQKNFDHFIKKINHQLKEKIKIYFILLLLPGCLTYLSRELYPEDINFFFEINSFELIFFSAFYLGISKISYKYFIKSTLIIGFVIHYIATILIGSLIYILINIGNPNLSIESFNNIINSENFRLIILNYSFATIAVIIIYFNTGRVVQQMLYGDMPDKKKSHIFIHLLFIYMIWLSNFLVNLLVLDPNSERLTISTNLSNYLSIHEMDLIGIAGFYSGLLHLKRYPQLLSIIGISILPYYLFLYYFNVNTPIYATTPLVWLIYYVLGEKISHTLYLRHYSLKH
ncbi:hypothetical protein [Candidatus Thiothrix anitrata]|uniref:Uncharacterized protein n=1 Tax=Candidatus Thiothrix anitrata TaxID=2823902 RepID=A0ABX7WYZ1_9GAMM|nr:hypothetical protein [Candidatus Thiothrix anitrata]QTR48956.1 hypothetical protein J8380_11785 [Candidatus Thiothrix anitrata]